MGHRRTGPRDVGTDRTETGDSSADPTTRAAFDAFFDFAFPRVHRFARRRTTSEAEAQALSRLILVRALTSLGGLGALEDRVHRAPADFAFWLYCLARRTADAVAADPERLLELDASHEGDVGFPADRFDSMFPPVRRVEPEPERVERASR